MARRDQEFKPIHMDGKNKGRSETGLRMGCIFQQKLISLLLERAQFLIWNASPAYHSPNRRQQERDHENEVSLSASP